ncbi:MAG TPA: leucyl aminopeptidase [Oscillatoriaceae cyanobacterium]
MSLKLLTVPLPEVRTDALVLLLPENADVAPFATVDRLTQGQLAAVLEDGRFKGKAEETLVLHAPGSNVKRIVLSGLGKAEEITAERLRRAAGRGATTARDTGARQVTIALPAPQDWHPKKPLDAETMAQSIGEGALLALYQMNAYRTQDREEIKSVEDLTMLPPVDVDLAPYRRGLATAKILGEAVAMARDLILHPGNVMTPERLAQEAQDMGKRVGLEVQVFDKAELEKRGFGCLLGINQGSVLPPRFILLEWKGADEAPIAIVGKGITFDTGGIGIKPGAGMEKMKYDMAGGASTLAILRAVAELELSRHVVGLIPATENMPSATAIKPGDVVKSYAGLTVEVNDTDAEGRVVLSDALAYAVKDLKAQAIIDMATLTGAVGVALGRSVMGVMGNDEALIHRVIQAGEHTGERGWHLPIVDEYEEAWKSDIADLKNYGNRFGDAINAAGFLRNFVGDTPWVHLDIAGIGWSDKDKPYSPKGPTGAPIRAVVDVLRTWQPVG